MAITKVNIKGSVGVLSELVMEIDKIMQGIYVSTNEQRVLLNKYSGANQGMQYQRAVKAIEVFSDGLYHASEKINEVQRDVVRCENKIHDFLDDMQTAVKPRQLLIKKVKVDVGSNTVFDLNDMKYILKSMRDYGADITEKCSRLKNLIIRAGDYWNDPQYDKFKTMISMVLGFIADGYRELEAYMLYLQKRIYEFENN